MDCKFNCLLLLSGPLSASWRVHSLGAFRVKDLTQSWSTLWMTWWDRQWCIRRFRGARAILFVRIYVLRSDLLQHSDHIPQGFHFFQCYEVVSWEELSIDTVDKFLTCIRVKWDQNSRSLWKALWREQVWPFSLWQNWRKNSRGLGEYRANLLTECVITEEHLRWISERDQGHWSCSFWTDSTTHLEMHKLFSYDTKGRWAESFGFLEHYMLWIVDGSEYWVGFVTGRDIWAGVDGNEFWEGKWIIRLMTFLSY